MNTENKFEWTDELVKDFVRENFNHNELNYLPHAIWQFKKSKQQNTIQKDWEIVNWVWTSGGSNGIPRKIESVRRLSDGEVFSLGDDVNFGIIEGFYICEEEDSFCYKCMMVYFKEVRANRDISELKKANQPLFKTEDGIDVYEGDRYYVVIEKDGFGYETFAVAWHGQGGIESANYKNAAKFFSDKGKANEYILMNQPVLSVNDVLAVCENNYGFLQNKLLDRLKEIAKSKIEGK